MLFDPFPNGVLEIQIIEISSGIGTLRIANLYNPHKNVTITELRYYFEILGNKCIFIGDWNAHSPLWDSRGRSNSTVRNLEIFLENYPVQLINDTNLATYIDYATRSTSCLDLCIGTNNLNNISDFKRGRDIGSDHFPIEITFGFRMLKKDMKTLPRWKLKEANWREWTKMLETNTEADVYFPLDIAVSYTHLTLPTNREV